MRLTSLFVAFLMTASTFSATAAEPIKELNISYVKPPFVLQLLVMKDHKLLEKEFQADGIKINWHESSSRSGYGFGEPGHCRQHEYRCASHAQL